MLFLRTLGWLVCVVYSTIPLFWLMVHPRADVWRKKERSPFRVLVPAWIVMWIGIGALTGPWRGVTLYLTNWTWIPAGLLFAAGLLIYSRAGAHFSWAQLGGLPEVRTGHRDEHLITNDIRARVRHPVYLGHLCEMLAWSLGTSLLVCWLLTAFAIATGAVMIRMEDAELEKRFGEEFRKYRNKVPAVLPRTSEPPERPRLSSDGKIIRYQLHDQEIWQIALADVVCIGEYTKSAFLLEDDYFLVFGRKNGLWYEASFYAEGRDATIRMIGNALRCELILGLCNSTQFASRILWPKQLEGQPLFVGKSLNPDAKRLSESPQL